MGKEQEKRQERVLARLDVQDRWLAELGKAIVGLEAKVDRLLAIAVAAAPRTDLPLYPNQPPVPAQPTQPPAAE